MVDENGVRANKKQWTYEQLNGGQTILGLQTGTNRFATQKGMKAFGMPRATVVRTDDGKLMEPDRLSEGVLTAQRGTNKFASQKGQSAFTNFRPNVCVMQEEGHKYVPKGSQQVLPMQSGSNKYASQSGGQVVIGGRRNQCTQVRGRMPKDRRSEKLIPFQSGTNMFASQNGMADPPGVGAYRRMIVQPEGLNFTEDQIRQSSVEVPWSAGTNKFCTQSGLGGFLKHRDVVSKCTGGKQLPEEIQRKSDGILPLQFGTNKLASQSGMTGFGTARSVLTKSQWKKEWVDQLESAKQDWTIHVHDTKPADLGDEKIDSPGEPVNPESLRLGSTVRQYGHQKEDGQQKNGNQSDEDDEVIYSDSE